MPLPKPIPGLVIRYGYLWHREHVEGREESLKDRPCAIVAAIREDKDGKTKVLVLPITHNPPSPSVQAVELPLKVKQHLKLDDARSWIVLSEWNEFIWPGPDLRRLPGPDNSSIAHGMLPPRLFASIRLAFLELVRKRKSRPVNRT